MNAPITTLLTPSLIAQGNSALRDKEYERAIRFYIQALQATPDLANIISGNIELARQRYRQARQSQSRQRVGVCGWELAHNAAGRVYTLAKLYETFADVEIIGSIFPTHGREVWEPIRNTIIPCHTFVVDDQSRFIEQAIELVAAHPYDIVHLSKPRASNIFFGILYKLIWDAKVLVDIDDEELAFVDAETSISIDDYIKQHGKLPELKDLAGKDWTRLAVGLAKEFDGITVSNPALQQRYGGEIIRHARDEKLFNPTPELKRKSREKFGIPQDKKVVLFFGTPREHKGLLETAEAIAALKRKNVLFVIVGDFPNPALKKKLQETKGCECAFIGNQPFDAIPDVVALGDYCVLLQECNSLVSKFQVPAKLSDALGMGLRVLAINTAPITEFIESGAVLEITSQTIHQKLAALLSEDEVPRDKAEISAFKSLLSFGAVAPELQNIAQQSQTNRFITEYVLQFLKTLEPRIYSSLIPLAEVCTQNKKGEEESKRTESHSIRSTKPNNSTDFDAPEVSKNNIGYLPPALLTSIGTQSTRVAVVVHYYYSDIWLEIKDKLKALSNSFDLFITTPPEKAESALKDVLADFPRARFHIVPNMGMDIVPFLSIIPTLANEGYLAVCKLQTKKGDGELAIIWRKLMLDALIGSSQNFSLAVNAFANDKDLCMVGPGALYLSGQRLMYDNADNLSSILNLTYTTNLPESDWGFFAGTMFWARVDTLMAISRHATFGHPALNGEYKKDGKFEHALERVFGLLPRIHSGKVGLLQSSGVKNTDCDLIIYDSYQSIGRAHVGDVMRQMVRIDEDVDTIKKSGKFNSDYYLSLSPELIGKKVDLVLHYLTQGTHRGLLPCKNFTTYQEISRFLRNRGDGRDPFLFYVENNCDNEIILKIVNVKWPSYMHHYDAIKQSQLFDTEFYIKQNQFLRMSGADPIEHYLKEGVFNEMFPSPFFIPREYRALHSDVVGAGIEPFYHYITSGAQEGRRYRSTLRREAEESPFYRFVVLNEMLIKWEILATKIYAKDTVSIVIPIFNNAELTKTCLKSVLETPVNVDFEIICVDNGSDEETKNCLRAFQKSHSKVKVIENRENYNFALGSNLGFQAVSGSRVVFLNNDTTVTPGWLDELVAPLEDPHVAAVQPKLLYPDGTVQCIGVVFAPKQTLGYPIYAGFNGNEECVKISRDYQAITAACMAVRASDFACMKGFDPTFINGQEDIDLCLRLTVDSKRVCRYQASSLVYHYESRTPNRGKFIPLNRKTFSDRWRNRITPDDFIYYGEDKYKILRYIKDIESMVKLGIGISRPELEKLAVSRILYHWNEYRENLVLHRLRDLHHKKRGYFDNVLVSVIMPTFNRGHLMASAIQSVLEQTHTNLELLVVDDGSADQTSEAVRIFLDDPRFKYVPMAHVGVSGARNKGLELSSGQYIAYLDTDNRWDADFIRNMLVFMRHGNLDAAYSSIRAVNDQGETRYYRGDNFDWNECLIENYIDINAFVHSKEKSLSCRFDQTLLRMVDWDFILHITKNARVCHLPYLGVTYYDGDKNQRITRTEYLGDKLISMQDAIRKKHDTKTGDPYSTFGQQLSTDELLLESNLGNTNIDYGNKDKQNLITLTSNNASLAFRIKIGCPTLSMSNEWGDYHFACAIKRSLESRGHKCEVDCLDSWESADAETSDVILVLRGLSRYKPKPHQINLMWNISHPDKVTHDEYMEYDHVFVASAKYARSLSKNIATPVTALLQCTDPSLFNTSVPMRERHEYLFVGNSRNVYRKIVKDALSVGLTVSVFGTRWEQFISKEHRKGEHILNTELAGYYASAGIVLNDHWDTMHEYGFLSNRLFDATACGAIVLSDDVDGLSEVFGMHVLTYSNPQELLQLVSDSSRFPSIESRLDFAKHVQEKHNFDIRVNDVLQVSQNLIYREAFING